jgi:hypothetical protein
VALLPYFIKGLCIEEYRMPLHRIWIGQDADVLVYFSDKQGTRLGPTHNPWTDADGPLLLYCFLQSTTLSGNLPNQRRPVTGRPQPRIVVQAFEYELDVDHFYLSKAKELNLDNIFNREQPLELVLRMQTLDDPAQPLTSDPHTLKVAKAVQFTITSNDNENVRGRVKFMAERFE